MYLIAIMFTMMNYLNDKYFVHVVYILNGDSVVSI